jgi:hypothetical protein
MKYFRRVLHQSELHEILPSSFASVTTQYTCGQLCMCTERSPVEILTSIHRNVIGRSVPPPPNRLCFRPPVFFRHLRFIALSFPTRKNSGGVEKILFQFFSLFKKNLLGIKLRKFKFRKLGSGCILDKITNSYPWKIKFLYPYILDTLTRWESLHYIEIC